MKKILAVLGIFIVCLLAFLFYKESLLLPKSTELIQGRLENGMEYYILENKKPENRATLNLVVKAGSLLETDEQQGLAHFLEHMAFNGTKKYKKNDMIKYLQSIGLNFGGDLNAYTSFSETVYELQIPTDLKNLNTGLEILEEWTSNITLDKEEIEKEKKVIVEEWRLRQGIAQRVGDIQKRILFANSRYQNRFPIGLVEVIEGANYNLLKNFYDDWYQPKNMAIIAVGDFNSKEIEKMIKERFSKLKNTNGLKIREYTIPLASQNSIEIFTDPEITTTNFRIMWKDENYSLKSKKNLRDELIEQLFYSIINTRYSILSKKSTSPFVATSFYNYGLNKGTRVQIINSKVKDRKLNEAVTEVLTQFKDIQINGVTTQELEKEKTEYLNYLKTRINNKESITNSNYATRILGQVLEENQFIDIEKLHPLAEKILKTIDKKDLQDFANHILKLKYDVFITAQESLKEYLPNKMDLMIKINEILSEKTLQKKGLNLNVELTKLNLENGKIRSEIDEKEYKKYILSNGIEVYYKKTDYEKDNIRFKLFKYQGSSGLDFKSYINTLFLSKLLIDSGVGEIDYKSLPLYFKGKNFSVTPFIRDYSQGFIIASNKKDLEEGLNYFRTLIKEPKFDKEILENILEVNKEAIINRENSPNYHLKKTYLESLTDNPRRLPIELDNLKVVSAEEIRGGFNELFSNFYNYKLIVVGNIDEAELKNILEKYFASLPSKENRFSYKPLNITYPEGEIIKKVVKGIDKKATIIMNFPYKSSFSHENRVLYNAFSNLLNILLIEEIREKSGGVYSIATYADLDYMNFNENSLQIQFSTDPHRVEEIINRVKEVISNVQTGKFSNEKINDIQNNYRLNLETALKTNSFWNRYLERKVLFENYEYYTPSKYNEVVTFESILDFSEKALDLTNCIIVILEPEKEE